MADFVNLWVYLSATPLFGLTATLGVYVLASAIYLRLDHAPWANPVLWSVLTLALLLQLVPTRGDARGRQPGDLVEELVRGRHVDERRGLRRVGCRGRTDAHHSYNAEQGRDNTSKDTANTTHHEPPSHGHLRLG